MKKKIVIALVAAALLVGGVAGGTLAWLTAESQEVQNTFTVGDITIKLDETTKGDTADGKYKIVPGGKSAKDPTVTVEAGSEECYVYVLIENEVRFGEQILAMPNINTATEWVEVDTDKTTGKSLYRYKTTVDATNAAVKIPVFTEVSYNGEHITEANIASLEGKTITVKAYAHQSDAGEAAADAAAYGWAFT